MSNNRVSTLETNLTDISNNRWDAVETSLNNLLISDVSGLQIALDYKQTKITANDYLLISDVSGLQTTLDYVDIGDIFMDYKQL